MDRDERIMGWNEEEVEDETGLENQQIQLVTELKQDGGALEAAHQSAELGRCGWCLWYAIGRSTAPKISRRTCTSFGAL